VGGCPIRRSRVGSVTANSPRRGVEGAEEQSGERFGGAVVDETCDELLVIDQDAVNGAAGHVGEERGDVLQVDRVSGGER